MKILVTAFKPFNKLNNNYSEEVLKYIENVDKYVIDVVMLQDPEVKSILQQLGGSHGRNE